MTKLSCGKKTTSGRLLGCVIFFPRLTYVVNQGVRGGEEPPLFGGWVAPLYRVRGSAPGKFFLDPILGWANLPMVFGPWFWTRWFLVHGIGCFGMYKYVL